MNWFVMAVRNGFHMTLKAAQSVMAQDCGHCKLVIINNGTDGTGYKVQQWEPAWKPHVWVVDNSQRPQSVAASWNAGLNFAYGQIGSQKRLTPMTPVLVLNNDCVLHPSTFRILDQIQVPFVTPCSLRTEAEVAAMPIDLDHRTPNPDFTAFMIRRWVFEKVQFDEQFQAAYVEDVDYHMRLYAAGIPAIKVNVPLLTIGGGTSKINPELSDEIIAAATANRAYFKQKWGFEVPPNDGGKYDAYFATKGTA